MNVHTRLILGMLLVPVLATGAGSSVWLDVPYVHQEKEGCGSAALAMILQYWSQKGAALPAERFDAERIQRELHSKEARGIRASAMEEYLREHKGRLQARLDALHAGFRRMAQAGLPVRDIPPQGAIYLSVRVAIAGQTNETTRKLLLESAGFAVVPFQAFGLREDSGWFRISVGAVGLPDIDAAFPRLRAALPKRSV